MKLVYKLSILALRAVAQQSVGAISGSLVAYGASAPQLAAYQSAYDNYDAALTDAEAAKAAYHAAIAAQNEAREALLGEMATIWDVISHKSTVTDSMITAAGFTPKDTTRTQHDPITVSDVIATPFANGTVSLKWNRNGNASLTTSLIETQAPGSDEWTFAFQTTKTKVTLGGFPAGDPANFRITSQRGEQYSFPSETVIVYAPAPMASAFMEAA